jgi:hypothetical protein
VHDRAAGARDRLVGALDQLGSALGEHLDGDVVGDQVLLDELAHEVEVGLEADGKPTSISLKPMATRVSNMRACGPGPSGR